MKTLTRISNRYRLVGAVLLVAILPISTLAQGDPYCCSGRVGDVNGLGGDEPTIGDVAAMIDCKFIETTPCYDAIPCILEADINQSGGADPSYADITIGDIAVLIDYLFITGPSLGLANCLEPTTDPYGYLVSNSDCKTYGGAALADPIPSEAQSCLQYDYDGTGTLLMTHLNAAFNCCPDFLTAVFSIVGNTITITEGENLNSGGCDCICLYDLQFQINNLPPGEYHIVVNEPYAGGEDILLDFVVDLSQAVSDVYCVDRTHYPWGTEGTAGYMIGHTDCKSFTGSALADPVPSDQDCLQYSYDGAGTLNLVHVNAGFNCCPTSLSADFSFDGNTITITETENLEGGGCYCLCLYDMSYVITGLPPGEYHIVVNEPYAEGNGDPLDFVIDLTAAGDGSFCVERIGYPWGGSEPGLEFIGNSGCLSQGAATSVEVNDQTCVSYAYNEFGTLAINRGMAGFNCCPSELGASFSIDGNTITITEGENLEGGGCHCLCLFDMEYWITNLPPGEYTIVIEEPYLPSGDQPLEFMVDLTSPAEGTHCQARSDYPWGSM